MSLVTFATDTFLTGGRGTPNAVSPGSDGNNWTQQRGIQTASYSANQGVFTYGGNSTLGVWTYGSVQQTDQEVLVNATQHIADNEQIGAVLRCTDDSHFYYAIKGNTSGKIEIGKNVGGSFTQLATADFSSSFGTKYSIRFQVIGSTLKARIWDAATSEPTNWNAQATDTALYSGLYGICMAPAGGSYCAFDTFSATNGATTSNNPVNPTYGAEQLGLIAGALNAVLVPPQDITAYEVWSLQVDTIATGGVVTFEGSNDGITYYPTLAYKADGTSATSTNATGLFWGPRLYRYYQALQTSWTSGATKGTFELYTSAAAFAFVVPLPTGASTEATLASVKADLDILAAIVSSGKAAIKAASGDFADGALTTLGAKADAKNSATDTTAITAMQVLKQISYMLQNPVTPSSDVTVLASAARTTTQTQADQTNTTAKGIKVVLDMTDVTASPSVTLEIDGKDPASGKYYSLLTGAAVTTVSTNVYTVYPGAPATANVSANDVLPHTYRIKVTANNANSGTYSVGASLLP